MTINEARVNAPEFPTDLEWINSERPLTLRELRGKIVLLEFWTFGCINCNHNVPQVSKLQAQFPDELVVIGVHSAKFPSEQLTATIREAVLRLEITYPVVNDAGFRIWSEYAVRAWPTVVLIDDRGKVVRTQSGEIMAEELAPAIQSLVALAEARNTLYRSPLTPHPTLLNEPMRPLRYPGKLFVAPDERLFVADTGHHRIIELALSPDGFSARVERVFGSGVAGLVDGPGDTAAFHNPHGMDLDGSMLFVADTGNHAVRAIDLASGMVTTVAGTGAKAHARLAVGAPTETSLRSPWDVVTMGGGVVFIAMAGSHQVWVLLSDGRLGPWAGAGFEGLVDGPRAEAGFNQPSDLDIGGGYLFVADPEASAIRAISLGEESEVITLVGQGLFEFGDSDGEGEAVRLQHPGGLLYGGGLVFIADSYNNKIKVLDPTTNAVQTLIGTGEAGHSDGSFVTATLFEPEGLALHQLDETLLIYIADTNNHLVRVADLATGELHTLHIQGLEQLAPTHQDAPEAQRLDQIVVGAGEVAITFEWQLPDGYKLNPEAPLAIRELDNGHIHSFAADQEPTLLIDVTGDHELMLDLTIYYCESENEGLCLIHNKRVILPIAVALNGSNAVRIPYVI